MRNELFPVMFFAILALFIVSCKSSESPVQLSIESVTSDKVCIDETCFSVEVADTYALRQKGLMFRDSLDDDKGMLFIFDEPGEHRFWMKNTIIPLDIIWIDENSTVLFISSDTQPCKAVPCPSYGPDTKALYVLEINAGLAAKRGIESGDLLELEISR